MVSCAQGGNLQSPPSLAHSRSMGIPDRKVSSRVASPGLVGIAGSLGCPVCSLASVDHQIHAWSRLRRPSLGCSFCALQDVWILHHLEPPLRQRVPPSQTPVPGDGRSSQRLLHRRGRKGAAIGWGQGEDASRIWNRGEELCVRGKVEPVWWFRDEYRNRPHCHPRPHEPRLSSVPSCG